MMLEFKDFNLLFKTAFKNTASVVTMHNTHILFLQNEFKDTKLLGWWLSRAYEVNTRALSKVVGAFDCGNCDSTVKPLCKTAKYVTTSGSWYHMMRVMCNRCVRYKKREPHNWIIRL